MTRLFFQAEDGIRDLTVTGVQTCALPISWLQRERLDHPRWHLPGVARRIVERLRESRGVVELVRHVIGLCRLRSEERRVGKECSDGWAAGLRSRDRSDRDGIEGSHQGIRP